VTVDITATYQNGLTKYSPGSWSTIRNATVANYLDVDYCLPQTYYGGNYLARTVACLFNTNAIPSEAIILSVIFRYWQTFKQNVNASSLNIWKKNDWSRPSNPPVKADYRVIYHETKLGEKTLASSVAGWNDITLTQLTSVRKANITNLYFCNSRFPDNLAPTGDNECGDTGTLHKPRLIITYAP